MNHERWNGFLAVFLGTVCLLSGCGEEETPTVDSRGIPLELQLIYDDASVDRACAELISDYFTAIQNKDYDAYSKVIYPAYYSEMEEYLQEKYDYGMEQSFLNRVGMFEITDENNFRFTQIKLDAVTENSLDNYFTQMNTLMGDDFEENIRSGMDEHQILMFSVNAISDDMEQETTVVNNNEMIVVTADDQYYLIG